MDGNDLRRRVNSKTVRQAVFNALPLRPGLVSPSTPDGQKALSVWRMDAWVELIDPAAGSVGGPAMTASEDADSWMMGRQACSSVRKVRIRGLLRPPALELLDSDVMADGTVIAGLTRGNPAVPATPDCAQRKWELGRLRAACNTNSTAGGLAVSYADLFEALEQGVTNVRLSSASAGSGGGAAGADYSSSDDVDDAHASSRPDVRSYLRRKKAEGPFRVLDVGGSLGSSWLQGLSDAFLDLLPSDACTALDNCTMFTGNLNEPGGWAQVLAHVQQHGKFDFASCTHTLEDIANAPFAMAMLSRVARAGFVAVPSKYSELHRGGGEQPWAHRGCLHHRWIFAPRGGAVVAFPKLNALEYLNALDVHAGGDPRHAELSFWWRGDFFEAEAAGPTRRFLSGSAMVANGDFMGPNARAVVKMFLDGLGCDDADAVASLGITPAEARRLEYCPEARLQSLGPIPQVLA